MMDQRTTAIISVSLTIIICIIVTVLFSVTNFLGGESGKLHHHVIKVFVSKHCYHCAVFQAELTKLKQMSESSEYDFELQIFDAQTHKDVIARNYKIRGFPTILVDSVEYTGPRTAKSIAGKFVM